MAPTKRPRQAVIYCRISSDREGREFGVDRQEAHCRRLADRRGWHVVSVLVDNDITGTGNKKRPGYNQLLNMLQEGTANAILAVSDKRLNRNYRNAFALLDLIHEQDIAVEFTKGGAINMNTAEGRGIARRKAIDAQEESEEIGERVSDAKKDNVRDGTYRGGGRPFGYEADGITPRSLLCPDCGATEGFRITATRGDHAIETVKVTCPNGCMAEPDLAEGSEAWHLRAATEAVAEGASVRSVLRDWQAAGVRTPARRKRLPDGTRTEPTPGDWTPTTLLKLLRRPRNAGLMEVAGEITGKGAWPAIVDEETWRICEAVLKNPARRTSPGPSRKYLGGGLYLCGVCGELVVTTGRGRTRNGSSYTCGTGGHVSRNTAAVDDLVERTVIGQMAWEAVRDPFWPPAAPAPAPQPIDDLNARHAALNARLKGLADAFADDDEADPVEYRSAARRIREKITAVEQQIAEAVTASAVAAQPRPVDSIDVPELVRRHRADPDDALTWWRETYPLERRRKILKTVTVVTLVPGRQGRPPGWVPGTPYFDPESVQIDWTGEYV